MTTQIVNSKLRLPALLVVFVFCGIVCKAALVSAANKQPGRTLPQAALTVPLDTQKWKEIDLSEAHRLQAIELFLNHKEIPDLQRMVIGRLHFEQPKISACVLEKEAAERSGLKVKTLESVRGWDCFYSISKEGKKGSLMAVRTLRRGNGKIKPIWSSAVVLETGVRANDVDETSSFRSWISSVRNTR